MSKTLLCTARPEPPRLTAHPSLSMDERVAQEHACRRTSPQHNQLGLIPTLVLGPLNQLESDLQSAQTIFASALDTQTPPSAEDVAAILAAVQDAESQLDAAVDLLTPAGAKPLGDDAPVARALRKELKGTISDLTQLGQHLKHLLKGLLT